MWHSVPLTLFWFFYMGSLGILFPYFSLYLRENAGLSGPELGVVLAIPPLVGIFAQPFWGRVADRTGARSRTLAIVTACTALGYLGLIFADGFWTIVLATVVMALFGSAWFPITISVSLAILRDAGDHAFGYVRAWGTIGFFVSVMGFPFMLDYYPLSYGMVPVTARISQSGLELMFPAIAALVLIAAGIGVFLPQTGVVALRASRGDWRELLHNHAFVRFILFSLAANFLMHGPMWLFPIFVRSRGGDIDTIRNMWILMLLVEIPLVLLTGSGLRRIGSRGLLMVGVLLGGLRWVLCALVTDWQLLFAVQALHGVTVVGLNLGSPLYLDLIAPEKLRSTAQGMLSMVSVGIAGVASNTWAGWFLERGGTDKLYLICGIGSVALGALVGVILPLPASVRDKLQTHQFHAPR
jgi:PPP family 3-phenylpropionic acid transporter